MTNVSRCYYQQSQVNYSAQLNSNLSTEFSEVKEALSNESNLGSKIIEMLSQHPFLQECYSKIAQERFSVKEHTQRVLNLAEQYQGHLQQEVSKIVSWNEFILFLALHDIGKGIAKENESFAFGTNLSFKEGELETTQKILIRAMEMLEISPFKIRLFCEMLRYDTQGLYLTHDIPIEEAVDNILEMAHNAELDPCTFYQLFRTFHLLDAASYPSLRDYFVYDTNSLKYCSFYEEIEETLRNTLIETEKGRLFFEDCLKRIQTNEDPNIVYHDFLSHLPQLLKFLDKMHKEMLAYPEKQDSYRHIKRGFRDMLLSLAKSSQDLNTLQALYISSLSCALGRRKPNQTDDYKLDLFFDNASKIQGLLELKDKLIQFRKDYLCRYSLEKVEAFIRRETVAKQVQNGVDLSPRSLSLLNITYLHGTNSALLPTLLRTGMQLMAFERMKREHIEPLHEGSATVGSNQYRLPGVSLDYGMDVHSYAAQEKFQPIQSKEEKDIIKFLSNPKSFQNPNELLFLSQALLRLRAFDPDLYHTHQDELIDAIIEAQSQKTSQLKQSLEHLKKAMDKDLIPPEGIRNAFSKPYGLVFASTTLHTLASNLQDPSIRSAQKASLLGKDIQILFVSRKDRDRLRQFLEETGLKGRVALVNLDRLLNTALLNQLAAPYFADIASKKKLSNSGADKPRNIQPSSSITENTSENSNNQKNSYLRIMFGLLASAGAVFAFERLRK